MNRINIIDLAEPLALRHKLTRDEAQDFLEHVFAVIRDGINQEGVVKVRGLGTFKATSVESRESVNVNTGERIVIDSHPKLSFLPDPAMREVVNKPFSLFDTVILNDGVDFSDTDNEGGDDMTVRNYAEQDVPAVEGNPVPPTAEEQASAPAAGEEAEPVTEAETVMEKEEPVREEAVKPSTIGAPAEVDGGSDDLQEIPDQDIHTEEEEMETNLSPQDEDDTQGEGNADGEAEPAAVDDAQAATDEDDEQKPSHRTRLWWVALAAVLAAVLACVGTCNRDAITDIFSRQTADLPKNDTVVSHQKDTMATTATAPSDTSKTSIPSETSLAVKDTLPDYDAMDNRIRTGAYNIVGMDYTVKVREGETMERLTRRTLGPGMECYIETYNNIRDPLSGGQVVKIPKLQLKKKQRKTDNRQ